MFYIGQQIICIQDLSVYLAKGQKYIVNDICKTKCGITLIDWGVRAENPNGWTCHKCDEDIIKTKNPNYYVDSRFFQPLEEMDELIEL